MVTEGITTKPVDPGQLVSPDDEVVDVKGLGSKIRLTRVDDVILDRKLAESMLELVQFVGERAIVNRQVADLQRAMIRGTFMPERVQLCVAHCKEDGLDYRMNGQHTSWAVLELPENEKPAYKVKLYKYTCETMNDVRQLYSTFDRNLARSMGNVINAYVLGQTGFEKFDASAIRHVAAGFALWRWEHAHERQKYDGDARGALMITEFRDLSIGVLNMLMGLGRTPEIGHLWRAPTIAAIFETRSKVIGDSNTFWKGIADGLGFETKTDPRLKLRTLLRETSLSVRGQHTRVSQEYMYRACILAWNAWREGRELAYIKAGQVTKRPRAK